LQISFSWDVEHLNRFEIRVWGRMVSGAGHDSLHTAQFAPTAMIFVPCAGGLSHNEAEEASPTDLAAGANVLFQAVVAAANE
jgi:N-carbamoyl-L-amino-acid hydrolase